jgi:hypothetical protein
MSVEPNNAVKGELDKLFFNPKSGKVSERLDAILGFYKGAACRELPHEYLKVLVDDFKDYVAIAYSEIFKINIPNVPVLNFSNESVSTVVTQVWKRKIYFRIFHEGVKSMNEIKEAALYAFWILKLQPFYISGQPQTINKLNIQIALKIFLNGVISFVKGMNKKEPNSTKKYAFNFSGSLISDLYYSFKYRDWSKESLMDMGERLVIYPRSESSRTAASGHYDEEFKSKVVSEVLEKRLSPRVIAYKYDLPTDELNQWVSTRTSA